jgi:hypothetical protein
VRRLKFDELLRTLASSPASALAANSAGIRHDIDGSLVPEFHARPRSRRPTRTRDRRDQRRPRGQRSMPSPARRGGVGKTVVALTALLTAVQGGYQGVHGTNRGARRAARLTMRCSTGSWCRRRHAIATPRARGAAHQPDARRAPADRRLAGGRSTSSWAPSIYGGVDGQARARSHRRAAPLRRGAT